ncbi:hypothetical protein Tco_0264490 [Tanacetum coccineum]
MSTAEAECVSLSACCEQVIWMRMQLPDYGYRYNKILMYYDSKCANAISCNPVQHSHTKHIDIRYHFIKEQLKKVQLNFTLSGWSTNLLIYLLKPFQEKVFHMAQQIILESQLVPKFQGIRRRNNYDVLQSIPCSLECKIVGQILLDHPLSYALTAIVNLDIQEIVYTADMFRDTLHLPVETPNNLFITLVTIKTIESFMQTVGYQGVVDRMKKFSSIPSRLEVDYHFIKDDIPLVSVYTMGNVIVLGMLISNAFLTKEIRATDDYKEYDTVFVNVAIPMNQPQLVVSTQGTHRTTPRAHRTPTLTTASEKYDESYANKFDALMLHDDVDDSGDRIEPESHKEHPEVIDDDDENKEEKKDEMKDDEMGSLENMTEKMQTPIPTTSRSPYPQQKRCISSKYSHLPRALHRMCRRQGYMIRDMERKCVTTDEFWKVHRKVDQVLHEIVPQLAKRATNDFIEGNLKRVVADTVIQERDAFQAENNVIQVHPTTSTSTDITLSADLQQQLYLKMKSVLQDQVNDPALWDVLKQDDAPPEGEKRVKRHKVSKSSKSARGSSSKRSAKETVTYVTMQQQHQQQEWDAWEAETVIDDDEVIPEDKTPELITEFQNVDKRVLTIFDCARIEATLNDMLSNQFRNAEEYAYHLEQATNFMENQINGNTEENKYILSRHKIHAESFPEANLEEKINCIESYQIKVNLTAPTLTFHGIEEHEPYSIVDKPTMGLIYLNIKDEKRVMYLMEIVKFCDATLERVLNEVIFDEEKPGSS